VVSVAMLLAPSRIAPAARRAGVARAPCGRAGQESSSAPPWSGDYIAARAAARAARPPRHPSHHV